MISSRVLIEELADSVRARLSRPLAHRQWFAPARVELEDEKLLWSEEPQRVVRLGENILEGFLRLADAPPEQILKYAERWGVLELCHHDFPASHSSSYWPTRPAETHACPYEVLDTTGKVEIRQGDHHHCLPRGAVQGSPWEPVAAWRQWASRAKATLTVAAQLHNGRIAPEQEWRITCDTQGMTRGPGYWSTPRDLKAGWRELAYYLNCWLRLAGVTPWLEIVERPEESEEKGLAIYLGGGGLFGVLAVQLVLAVSKTDGLAICSGCGMGYLPSRQPRAKERHYCEECRRRKVPQRDAARDYRASLQKVERKPVRSRKGGQARRTGRRVTRLGR